MDILKKYLNFSEITAVIYIFLKKITLSRANILNLEFKIMHPVMLRKLKWIFLGGFSPDLQVKPVLFFRF